MYLRKSLLHGWVTAPLIVGTLGVLASAGWWWLLSGLIGGTLFWLWSYRKTQLPETVTELLTPHLIVLGVSLVLWCGLFTVAHYSYAADIMNWAQLAAPLYGLTTLVAVFFRLIADLPLLIGTNFVAPLIAILILVARRHAHVRWQRSSVVALGVLLLLCAWTGYAQYQHHLRYLDHAAEPSTVGVKQYRPFSQHNELARLDATSTLKLTGKLPKLDGATATYPLYAAAVQATYPHLGTHELRNTVQVNSTGDAFGRLIDGDCDVVFTARPSGAVVRAAKRKGLTLTCTPIAREAFVFFVAKQNPVHGLTTKQLQAIYQRKITNWHQVGGNFTTIRAFQRPASSGSQTVMRQMVMGKKSLAPALKSETIDGMGGIVSAVADYENSPSDIGYSFRYYLQGMKGVKHLRLLKVDGVAPTRTNIAANRYPFTADVVAVTARPRSAQTRALIKWLRGQQGQELVEKTGYVPLK